VVLLYGGVKRVDRGTFVERVLNVPIGAEMVSLQVVALLSGESAEVVGSREVKPITAKARCGSIHRAFIHLNLKPSIARIVLRISGDREHRFRRIVNTNSGGS
jgi:hypothetical protein